MILSSSKKVEEKTGVDRQPGVSLWVVGDRKREGANWRLDSGTRPGSLLSL